MVTSFFLPDVLATILQGLATPSVFVALYRRICKQTGLPLSRPHLLHLLRRSQRLQPEYPLHRHLPQLLKYKLSRFCEKLGVLVYFYISFTISSSSCNTSSLPSTHLTRSS